MHAALMRHLLRILSASNQHVFSIFAASFLHPNAGDSGVIRELFGDYSTGAAARIAEEMAPLVPSMTGGLALSPFRLQRYKKFLIYANFCKEFLKTKSMSIMNYIILWQKISE